MWWVLMEVTVGKKRERKRTAGSEAGIEVAASEIWPAHGISIIIISYISLGAILLPSLLH